MLEKGAFYLSLFMFGMFFFYLIIEGIRIIITKDKDMMKKVFECFIAVLANIAVIYFLLKMPRCVWCEEHPYVYGAIFIAIFWGGMLYFLKSQDKRGNKTNRQIWR